MITDFRTNVANVFVIGSGAAGLRAAIACKQAGLDVVVVGKRARGDAHTALAAGGINAALGSRDPEDSWEQHFADTYQEAYHLAIPRMVEILAREAPQAILELAGWGCRFNRTEDGQIDQRYFGAHKYRRTCYAGDFTGREILNTLDNKASELRIPVFSNQYVTRLLVTNGVCFGGLAFDINTGDRSVYLADAVVLATGGHTRLWRRSSSRRDENTGDGMYLAMQAGCSLAGMELVQFHPTGMVHPEEWAGVLVTEAVRGEGGFLLNSKGERFMQRYDPQRMELSTRDRVALAVYTEILEGRAGPHGGVFLDISHKGRDLIRQKLPQIYRQFLEAQMLDISQEKMEVAPTAHYSMGGVVVEPDSAATGVEGLFAAGEVTSGLHGANRLGGNSLVETIVFGRRAGEAAAEHSRSLTAQPRSPKAVRQAMEEIEAMFGEGEELPRLIQRRVRDVLWQYCGVVRSEERIHTGLQVIRELEQQAAHLDLKPGEGAYRDLAIAHDLRAGLRIAEITLLSALERRESRGAHQRYDFPDVDEGMQVSISTSLDEHGGIRIRREELPPIPNFLAERVAEVSDYDIQGRLLE